jgi:hypothetical protein
MSLHISAARATVHASISGTGEASGVIPSNPGRHLAITSLLAAF